MAIRNWDGAVVSCRTQQTSFVSEIPGCPGVSEVKPFLATSPPGNRPFLVTAPPGCTSDHSSLYKTYSTLVHPPPLIRRFLVTSHGILFAFAVAGRAKKLSWCVGTQNEKEPRAPSLRIT